MGKGLYGLLDLHGERRPSAEALATIFGSLPSNARVSGVADNGVLIVGSVLRPGTLLLIANPLDEASVISLHMQGQPEFSQD